MKGENVPGVDQGAAVDAAIDQVFHFEGRAEGGVEFAALYLPFGVSESPVNLGFEAGAGAGNRRGLFAGSIGVAHARVEFREVRPLHLSAAVVCQVQVEMLPDAAERLLVGLGLFAEAIGVGALQRFQQARVKGIPLPGDLGEQRREADRRIVCVGA